MAKTTDKYTEERNWYKDRYQAVLVQRKLLAVVTLMSLICTLVTVIVIAQLTPLKTIEPFVIQVDQKSGITQTVDPATVGQITANEAVNNFFIVQYVRARESYNVNDLARNYNIVRVMSENATVYPQFVAQADPNNPASNAARFGSTGNRTVKLKSISYLNPKIAQVRLLIEESNASSGGTQLHKVALVGFEYIKLTLTPEERYINPLGFRVTSYRIDDEVSQK
ncbi:MAG: type IV secretion system protein [Rickettsiales bacterium]|nr:type IV secretion system protein [Rickettsiales bacterium]